MLYKIILFFCLYLPFQLALNPAEGVDLASGRIIILILFLFWLISGIKNKKLIIAPKIQTFLIVSFLFLSAFSFSVSQNMEWSLRKLLFLFSIFPLYFIISGIKLNEEKIKKITQYLVWGAGLAGILGIFQFLLQFFFSIKKIFELWTVIIVPFLGNAFAQAVIENPSWLANIGGHNFFRSTAFFPDPHMFSFYLNIAFFLALGLYFTKDKFGKIYLLLSGFILLADLLTFSRGGYFGLLAGIFFYAYFFRNKIWINYKRFLIIGLIMIGLFIIIPNPAGERLISSFDLSEGSNKNRLATWENSLNVIRNNPIWGVGLGGYPLEIKPSAGYREPIYSHNAYLDIAAETGILNGLIWTGILLLAIFSFLKKKKNIYNLKYIYVAMTSGLIAFSVHSLFETPLFSARVLPLVLIIIALSALDYEKHH